MAAGMTLPLEWVRRWALNLVGALAHAHQRGIVHSEYDAVVACLLCCCRPQPRPLQVQIAMKGMLVV